MGTSRDLNSGALAKARRGLGIQINFRFKHFNYGVDAVRMMFASLQTVRQDERIDIIAESERFEEN